MNNRPSKSIAGKVQELPNDYEVLVQGPTRDVVTNSKVWKQLIKNISDDQHADLLDLMRRYGENGWDKVPPSKFKVNEGTFTSRLGHRVRLEAFKPRQVRAYGFCEQFNGKPVFFITGSDPSKKKNRADPAKLKNSGQEAARICDLLKPGD